MGNRSRPLSPHLQVYRFEWTMLLSITHRITGVGLALGSVLLVWWLIALAVGPDYFALVQSVMGSWIGRLVILGFTWALFYHFCNGIRHLCWDAGWGFELDTARNSGIAVIVGSVVLTVAFWLAAYFVRGI
jgi:succinate dehydrogenase / fumarate reductase cytochrome b subunit